MVTNQKGVVAKSTNQLVVESPLEKDIGAVGDVTPEPRVGALDDIQVRRGRIKVDAFLETP